jgi:DNA-binding response OmpR family regulator
MNQPQPERPSPKGQGRHVLLVEDEPHIAEAVRFLLMREGWQVTVHGNGADAAERVLMLAPDLLILDVMLPGASGLDVLAALRGNPATSGLPVLMLTARGLDRDRAAAEAAGASRFLSKPFANAEMLAEVRALMDARQAR